MGNPGSNEDLKNSMAGKSGSNMRQPHNKWGTLKKMSHQTRAKLNALKSELEENNR